MDVYLSVGGGAGGGAFTTATYKCMLLTFTLKGKLDESVKEENAILLNL